MTLLEKAKQEHPELDEEKLVTWMCPCDLGYESLPDGCEQMAVDGAEACVRCWNREAARERGDTSSAAAAADKLGMSRRASGSSLQGEGKAPSPQGEGNGEGGAGDGV